MNYYEELGIKATAEEEEIRKAHRRLVKLMHPDQQPDQSLKLLAETQMRRLNSIVATLLDAEQRREYDSQLYAKQTARPSHPTAWHSVPWWIASTLGAVVLTVGAVWFWADHLGSSFAGRTPVYISPQATASTPPATAAVPGNGRSTPSSQPEATPSVSVVDPPPSDDKQPAAGIRASVVPSSSRPDTWRVGGTENPKAKSKEAIAELDRARAAARAKATVNTPEKPKTFNLPVGARLASAEHGSYLSVKSVPLPPAPGLNASTPAREETSGIGLAALPNAPRGEPPLKPDAAPSNPVNTASAVTDPLEGEWVYAPKEPEKHKPGFYPPEFISLKLTKNDGSLHGQYSARYDVASNEPISPDVHFQLTAVDKVSHKFVWQSSNGSRGTLAIRSLDGRSIRLEWRTTVLSGGPALTSGIATLVRRSP
ncbi:MAG TPA: DnaJ domain-containing protein [Bryobacteraceae bacterium]|jgi:hypothetical protein